MNGLSELQLFYILLSAIGFAFIFACFEGFLLRVFKRFIR